MSVAESDIKPGFQFTEDWQSNYAAIWERIFTPQREFCQSILELGSFEGRSACWFLQHALADNGTFFSIDTWKGSPEFSSSVDMEAVYGRFRSNIALAKKPQQSIRYLRKTTTEGLAELIATKNRPAFDVIYVDASHVAADTLADACMAWPLLKSGGLMMFDDYAFGLQIPPHLRPKSAIDAFLNVHYEDMMIVLIGPQVIIKKD